MAEVIVSECRDPTPEECHHITLALVLWADACRLFQLPAAETVAKDAIDWWVQFRAAWSKARKAEQQCPDNP